MKQVFKVFFGAEGTRPFLVLLCLLVAAVAESIGISALLPAATAVAGQSGNSSAMNHTVRNIIESLGINPSFGNLILIIAIAMLVKSVIAFSVLS